MHAQSHATLVRHRMHSNHLSFTIQIFTVPFHHTLRLQYFHFVFTFYGRAVFYVFCATMLLGQFPYMPDMIVGLYMVRIEAPVLSPRIFCSACSSSTIRIRTRLQRRLLSALSPPCPPSRPSPLSRRCSPPALLQYSPRSQAFLAGMYITMGFKSSKKLKELKIQGEEEAKSVFGTYAQDGVLDKVSFGELLSKMVRS